MIALSYLRVSTAGQIDGDGLERQRTAIAEYAARAGLEVAAEFRDEGVSGTLDLADRAGLSALVERVADGGVAAVLVERADRLARDLVVSEMILRELVALGVRVVDCSSGTDLTGGDAEPSRALIRQVLAAVAQYEKGVMVHRMRAARSRMRREHGRCEGRKPYGARPGEAEVVARAAELRRAGLSVKRVAEELTASGARTRYGREWRPDQLARILRRGA